MKKKFLNYSLNLIKKYYPETDDVRLDELRYGLEGYYLTFTKLIVIFSLAYIFGIFKEMLIMLIIFNILRTTGFGLHATKSWICLLSSTIIFVCIPFIATKIVIPTIVKFILCLMSVVLIYLYAPADTIKRPLINKKKRTRYKYITTLSCIILNILVLVINSNSLSNLILFGIYVEVFLTNPYIYKLFNLSYDNYKNYKLVMD